MQVFTTPLLLPEKAKGAVVALGNFDGLHRGHQRVIGEAQALAKKKGKPFGVVTFEPHPRRVFFPDHPPFRLTPMAAKRRLLQEMGVEVLFEVPFTKELSEMDPTHFVEGLLRESFGISHAVAGYDFVFGHQRRGTLSLLKEILGGHGVGVTEITPVMDEGGSLWSSTRIREALQEGRVKDAAKALGRIWEMEGLVQKGDQRGRTLGFPTANIDMGETLRPRYGVYAVQAHVGGKTYKGVANIGKRPTVAGEKELLEVYLFDFNADIYGQNMRVGLVDFIREERRFPSLDALKAAIAEDCLEAKRRLA
jgi:riboflavin kinase/FMN adenylyltransferase